MCWIYLRKMTFFLCGLERGVVDNNVLWCWQQLCKGLYDIIAALPDWAELNEFRVITGSVCKQPHVMFETTDRASISRSFFLFQSLHFILSLAHLRSIITRVQEHACARTHTHTPFLCFIPTGVSLGSDVFKGISLLKLIFSSSTYLDFLFHFLLLDRIKRGHEKKRDIDKYF